MRGRITAGLVLAAVATLAAGCGVGSRQTGADNPSSAAEWTPQFKDGKLQPLPDGFPSRRLTLFNADEAGSSDGIYARVMQEALGSVSPVKVEVLDKPSGSNGTWGGLKFIQSKPEGKEGYYLQVMAYTGAGLDFLTDASVTKDTGYTVDDMNPVIATERVPFVVVMRGNAPWNSFQDLVDAAKANPGQLKYIAVNTGSQLDIGMMSIMDKLGISARKIPLQDNVAVATTIAAGQGDFSMELPDVVAGQYKAGRIKVPLVIGDKKPALFQQAQTSAEVGLNEPWGSLRGLMVTPETPDLHRRWLFELLKAAQKAKPYQDRLASVPGATEVTLDKDQVLGVVRNAMTLATPVLKKLNLYEGP